MRIWTIIVCLMIIQLSVFAQHTANFIILIDQDIPSGIQNPKMRIQLSEDSYREFSVEYYPGRLTVSDSLFAILKSENFMQLKLLLFYSEFVKKERKDHFYEISLHPKTFENYYNILRIYNTSKKRYRKMRPLNGLDYTYGFQDPSGWRMPAIK